MSETWLIADTHFGHEGVCRFLKSDGSKLRPWDTAAEMDEALVKNWNELVKPNDRVYVLGDVVINKKHLPTIGRCNGRKVLIKGNHDIFKLKDYIPYFDDIRGACVKKAGRNQNYQVVMTHVPVHPSSVTRWGINIHGHTHANKVMKLTNNGYSVEPDPVYVCVSVEQTYFKPLNWNTGIDWINLGKEIAYD